MLTKVRLGGMVHFSFEIGDYLSNPFSSDTHFLSDILECSRLIKSQMYDALHIFWKFANIFEVVAGVREAVSSRWCAVNAAVRRHGLPMFGMRINVGFRVGSHRTDTARRS